LELNTVGGDDLGQKRVAPRLRQLGLVLGLLFLLALPQAQALASSPLVWTPPETVDPHPDLHGPRSVSCPTDSLCVAIDGVGNVVTSTDPTGGAGTWSIANIDSSNELESVSCPSSTFCVAVDGVGNVLTSTNPTGGAGAWVATTLAEAEEPALGSISCASSSLCIAASGYDFGDNFFTSSNPTGGAGAWDSIELGVFAVACPSITLCVAGGWENNVLTSTNPTGGAGAWTVTSIEPSNGDYAQALSCPSTSLCVGATSNGGVMVSTNPTGGEAAWDAEDIDNARLLTVSCTTTPFCVAFDGAGGLLVGTVGLGHKLTVTVHGTGFVGSDGFGCFEGFAGCSRVDPSDTHVTLTAKASPGSDETFAGWSGGGCSGTGTCEVTMNSDIEVTASFKAGEEGGEPEPEESNQGGGSGGGADGGGTKGGSGNPPGSHEQAPSLPNTLLHSHPSAKLKTKSAKAKVKFKFSSSTPGATFKCKLDKAAFKPCRSPKTYKVKPGKHVFAVEAVGEAGADSTPAVYRFRVVRRR
jgi:hypothetical protein